MLARWLLNDLFLVGSSRSVALASGIRGLGTPAPLVATPGFLRRMAFILAQPTVDSGWHWVSERLNVRRRFGRVVLENHDNSDGYEWRGTGRIVDDRYISGQWKSTKPGSPSAGLFVLAMGFEVATWLDSSLERRSPVQSWQVALFSVERSKTLRPPRSACAQPDRCFPREQSQGGNAG